VGDNPFSHCGGFDSVLLFRSNHSGIALRAVFRAANPRIFPFMAAIKAVVIV